MKRNIAKALGELDSIMSGPPGHTDRTLAKAQKIEKARVAEERRAYAMRDHEEFCIDQLPEMGDEEDE